MTRPPFRASPGRSCMTRPPFHASPWRSLLILGGLAAFVLVGCGGGDRDPVDTPPAGAVADDPHAGHDMGATDPGAEGLTPDPEQGMEIRLDPARAGSLGIRSVAVERGDLVRSLRLSGQVQWDESRLSTVTLKYGGYIERLHVSFTGQEVRAGQVLFEVYAPEVVAAKEELLTAARLATRLAQSGLEGVADQSTQLLDAAQRRLELWDVDAREIERVLETGQVPRTHAITAPSSGYVVEQLVQVGERIEAGAPLYRLASADPVWVEARVPENDLRFLREGLQGVIELQAHPDRRLTGNITTLLPDVEAASRAGRVRFTLPNPGRVALPGMYAGVTVDVPVASDALLVPRDAVIRAGLRDVVFVEEEPGRFVAREVTLGAVSGDRIQVTSGLDDGDRVVARGAFLLDSESRLMTEMESMPGMVH